MKGEKGAAEVAANEARERAKAMVAEFSERHKLGSPIAEEVDKLVEAAIRERVAAESDLRIGRILASTFAHL